MFGVRYYISFTPEATEEARKDPPVGGTGRWRNPSTSSKCRPPQLVEVAGFQPSRFEESPDGEPDFFNFSLAWFERLDLADLWVVAEGPPDSEWRTVSSPSEVRPVVLPNREGSVSNIDVEDHRISFATEAVGVPHLVKVSYFPNWKATGADGPYLVAPSLMLVIPTESQVVIEFQNTWAEWLGWALTLGGTCRPGGSPLEKPADRGGVGSAPGGAGKEQLAVEDLFKAYDIRGDTATGAFTPDHARRIGAAFGRFAGCGGTVAVGRDCRESSPLLASALIEGIVSAGADVLDLGAVATEIVYYVSGAANVAGAMVTASHNPPQWNGIKLCMPGAAPVGAGSGLEESPPAGDPIPHQPAPRRGRVSARDVTDDYVNHIFSIVDPDSIAPLRVVVDGGNGMAATVVDPVFSRLPISLTGLYLTPDGRFPNHPPDPIDPANLGPICSLGWSRSAPTWVLPSTGMQTGRSSWTTGENPSRAVRSPP